MKFNRGLTPLSDDPARPRDLILVQAKDEEGFWCNISEQVDLKFAIKAAGQYASENHCQVRVVKGPKRDVVRIIEP